MVAKKKAAKKKSSSRNPIFLKTSGTGLWSNESREVKIINFDIAWVSDGEWDDSVYGELRVYFDTTTWNVKKHGLIYTDPQFIKQLRTLLRKLNLKGSDIDYTEQGMQGNNYVSINFGEVFYRSWQKKFNQDCLAVLRDKAGI